VEKIEVYSDGMLRIVCKDCKEVHWEDEGAGVLMGWKCPHCGNEQSRQDYDHTHMKRPLN